MNISFILNLHVDISDIYQLQSEIDQELLGTAKLKEIKGNKIETVHTTYFLSIMFTRSCLSSSK